jgi:predicted Zn-ribbon and HTH transcriptional regulator
MNTAEDVARVLASAKEPPTTDDVVETLKATHGEEDVLDALEHWHREVEAEQGVDGRWSWRGPPLR